MISARPLLRAAVLCCATALPSLVAGSAAASEPTAAASEPTAASSTGTAPAQRAAAEALFQEGRTLLQAGDYAVACARLTESYRLDPAGGTQLNLAVCHEKQGRLATAWAEFQSARTRAKREGLQARVTFAEAAIARLEPQLPRVVLEVDAPPGAELHIEIAGAELGRGAWSSAVPVDPGAVEIVAHADGFESHRQEVELSAGQTLAVHVPRLTPARPVALSDATATPRDSGASRRTTAYVAGGLGVAGLAAGSVFGLIALERKRQSEAGCAENLCEDRSSLDHYKNGQLNALLSNLGFGVGLAGLGVAAYLLLTDEAPSSSDERALLAAPYVTAHGGGAALQGRF